MDYNVLLGLPLSTVLERLGPDAENWKIVATTDPRHEREDGTLRVIRIREGELTVARFFDGVPVKHMNF